MKKQLITLSISLLLSSCNAPSETTPNKYTVTWKNDNGVILEIDNDVLEGSLPSYDGNIPIKEEDEGYRYVFLSWDKALSAVSGDITYTATFRRISKNSEVPESAPIISDDNKTVEYGLYPQAHVKDNELIACLNTLTESDDNGWYLYDGNYYVKETSNVYNNETYNFDDKTAITNNTEYWFKCEKIVWNVLSIESGVITLLSNKLLDAHNFYSNYDVRGETLPNDYLSSDIRNWLNNDFFNKAFGLDNSYIVSTSIDGNSDNVYLLSYEDYLNTSYGFDNDITKKSNTRCAATSEYARSKGAFASKDNAYLNNGSYWTRSASNNYNYCAYNVNSGGFVSEYAVDGDSHSVRPAIRIAI